MLAQLDIVVLPYAYLEDASTCSLAGETIVGLIEFVSRGGQLVLAACQEHYINANIILSAFGIVLDPEPLSVQDLTKPWILRPSFNLQLPANHYPFSSIKIHKSGYLKVDSPTASSILKFEDKSIISEDNYGKGKIIAIADSSIIAPPFIGAGDNLQLWLCLLNHLLQCPPYNISEIRIHSLLKLPNNDWQPPFSEQNPVIDCREFTKQFKAITNKLSLNPYTQREEFLYESTLLFDDFPKQVRERIKHFKTYGNSVGYLLLKGLPPDIDLINTPSKPNVIPNKSTYYSEFYLAAIGGGLGDVFTFAQEKGGNLFQNIAPTPQNSTNISSESSKIFLDFHTEIAFHPVNTDFLLLYCLRNDHEKIAKTLVISIHKIMSILPLIYYNVLFEELFQTGIDYSFGSPNGKKANGPVVSILSGDPLNPYFKCDFDLMVGLTSLAQEALDYIKNHAIEMSEEVLLEPGDLLVVDNNRALHGRSMFQARYDGQDRWLQRVLVVRDLHQFKKQMPIKNRTVAMQFAV